MILLIDNYDSFSYNLFQLVGSINPDVLVKRNDAVGIEEVERMAPEAIVLSPGPGRPEAAGICIDVVRRFSGRVPILGVCLGHQAICVAFGGQVSYAKELMHGKTSLITASPNSRLFQGIAQPFTAARYHSLSAVRQTLPDILRVTAEAENGEVMAVEHREYPVFGVQFHPESIMTPDGLQMITNFLAMGGAVK